MSIVNIKKYFYVAVLISLILTPAIYYTQKVNEFAGFNLLKNAQYHLLDIDDIVPLGATFVVAIIVLGLVLAILSRTYMPIANRIHVPSIKQYAIALFLLWLPFLFVFYPAPGMNDTTAILNGGSHVINQFPWLYSIGMSKIGKLFKYCLGTVEPWIFIVAIGQMMLMAYGLSFCIRKVFVLTKNALAAWLLFLYFAFFPMVGNYAIAVVRDPIYSLVLLLWVFFLFDHVGKIDEFDKRDVYHLVALLLGTMLLRSNAPAIMLVLVIALLWRKPRKIQKKIIITFLVCLAIAIVPGQLIMKHKHMQPLFQESAGMMLQQVGRVYALDGEMSDSQKAVLKHFYSDELWVKQYNPFNVDSIKWNRDFNRTKLNKEKKEFLHTWADIGKDNKRLYVEAWMLTSFWNWNVNLINPDNQSRFGWALDDEQDNPMQPSYNNSLSPGKLPILDQIKNALAHWQFDNSHFLGAGLCFWLSILAGGVFWVRKQKHLVVALLPLWLNTGTLILATPVSSVFRYSFCYVLTLPVILLLVLNPPRDKEDDDGKDF